jgi:hypothetical protein
VLRRGKENELPNIHFRGCRLQKFECKPKDGGRSVNATFQADYSDSLRKSMADYDWAELPHGSTEMGLKGQIIGCQNFVLTPNGGLKKEEIDVNCVAAKKFVVIRIQGQKKNTTEDVVRFRVTMSDAESVAKLDHYMNVVGDFDGVLKLIYATQEKITGAEDSQRSLIEIDSPKKGKDVQ